MDEPDFTDQIPVTQPSRKVAFFCTSVKWLHFCHVSWVRVDYRPSTLNSLLRRSDKICVMVVLAFLLSFHSQAACLCFCLSQKGATFSYFRFFYIMFYHLSSCKVLKWSGRTKESSKVFFQMALILNFKAAIFSAQFDINSSVRLPSAPASPVFVSALHLFSAARRREMKRLHERCVIITSAALQIIGSLSRAPPLWGVTHKKRMKRGDEKPSFLIVEKIAQNASHLLLLPPNAEPTWRQAGGAALTFSSFLLRSFALKTRPLSALSHTWAHKVYMHGFLFVGHLE